MFRWDEIEHGIPLSTRPLRSGARAGRESKGDYDGFAFLLQGGIGCFAGPFFFFLEDVEFSAEQEHCQR